MAPLCCGLRIHSETRHRKAHDEAGAATRICRRYRAAVPRHDVGHHPEPQPGSLASGLGGEESLEEAISRVRWETGPAVLNGENRHVIILADTNANDTIRVLRFHRLRCVDDQIDQYALERARVAVYRDGGGFAIALDDHPAFTQERAKSCDASGDDVTKQHGRVLCLVLASKGEQIV